MKLHGPAVGHLTRSFHPKSYVRLIPAIHRATPLGTGPSHSRFSSPSGSFNTLYAARNLATAIAETVIRDRFEGEDRRVLHADEFKQRCAAPISGVGPLRLLDIRKDGCLMLGVSTDITRAKAWDEARQLAQHVHDHTNLDGILYTSRLTGETCIAVFDRAVPTGLTSGRVRDVARLGALKPVLDSLFVDLVM